MEGKSDERDVWHANCKREIFWPGNQKEKSKRKTTLNMKIILKYTHKLKK